MLIKKTSLVIALMLLLTSSTAITAIEMTSAQSTRISYAYIGATPNPVGAGQEVLLHVGITQQLQLHWMGWEGLTVTVTRPDGTTETLGPLKTDSTGGTGTIYVPTMIGNYTLQTHFPEQSTEPQKMAAGTPSNTIVKASDSRLLTLVVQENLIPTWPSMPLPSEYWTRPIDSNIHEWYSISGNWLTTPNNLFAPYNDNAPETAHILWQTQLSMGGLVGGLMGKDNRTHAFESGDAYEGKFEYSAIVGGILYYNRYNSLERGGLPSQGIYAVDLHTGEELWFKNNTRLTFAQVLYWDSFNYHGAFSYLWAHEAQERTQSAGGTYHVYDAFTGEWAYTMKDVPAGENVIGENGEILRYTINSARGWMTLWNSTRVGNPQDRGDSWDGSWARNMARDGYNRTYPASRGIQWNKTIPIGLPGSAFLYNPEDRIVGSSISTTEVIVWGISLKQGQEGQLLFNKTWNAPADWAAGNQTISRSAGSIEDDLMTVWSKETNQHWGFSTLTGNYLWGPTAPQDYLDLFGHRALIAYGKFFSQGMSGILYCYDAKTGTLLWTYLADDPYNQVLWANQWHIRPLIVTDGKIYMGTSEHSPVDPKPKGSPFVCVDIETGKEIFRVDNLFRQTDWGGRAIIGDSIIATMDTFDQRIYTIGKGPSATEITASPKSSILGNSIIVEGWVTDQSPGTKEHSLQARFHKGVPAIADEYMSEWMLYVYKQFPKPANASGVEVTIDIIDANGNYRNIGKTTSDASGFFSFNWKPDIEGKYTIYATFAGSQSYWPSYAVSAFNIDQAPQASPTANPVATQSNLEIYIIAGVVAIIVAIAMVGTLILRKKP